MPVQGATATLAIPTPDEGSKVDLRSDTVTHPTPAMYERMMRAPIGDDGLDGDPTARELEAETAQVLGKDAGLFVPSCTMANLIAILAQSQRGEQVVLEANAHIYNSERGSGTFTGLFYLPVPGTAGAMDLDVLEDVLNPTGHRLKTALVGLETSHNNAGGAVLPLDHMAKVHQMAHRRGVRVHIDGARLFNAAVYLGVTPAEVARSSDTVSLCLSKGLSAPVGAVLAGPKATIEKGRTLRRMLGGAQRQVGIMAAAGLEGVAHHGAAPRRGSPPRPPPQRRGECIGHAALGQRAPDQYRAGGCLPHRPRQRRLGGPARRRGPARPSLGPPAPALRDPPPDRRCRHRTRHRRLQDRHRPDPRAPCEARGGESSATRPPPAPRTDVRWSGRRRERKGHPLLNWK